MLPREDLLNGVDNRETLARILDLAEQSLKTWEVVCSDFLSPPELAEAMERLQPLTEVEALPWGGYPQAERQCLALGRPEVISDRSAAEVVEVAAIDIQGNFLFDPASHRDFMGALLGTGIVREKTGDILVLGERGAQGIVVPEMVEFLQAHLTQVRTVSVKTTPVPLDQLKVRPPKTKSVTSTEASMRLDAVGSAGFSMSRSKMVDEIERGDVRVNWKIITQPSHTVKPTDLITIRGRGRVQIEEVMETKKGRYRVQMTRYM